MTEDVRLSVPLSLLNRIAQYLSTRPYADVAGMMGALADQNVVRPMKSETPEQDAMAPENLQKGNPNAEN